MVTSYELIKGINGLVRKICQTTSHCLQRKNEMPPKSHTISECQRILVEKSHTNLRESLTFV